MEAITSRLEAGTPDTPEAEVEEALVRLRGILEEERCRREFRGSRCQVDPYRMGASPQPP